MSKKWLWVAIGAVVVVGLALVLCARCFVYVDIRGDVQNPGGYRFLTGARISHAFEAAGWPTGRLFVQTWTKKDSAVYAGATTKLEDEMTVLATRAVQCPSCDGWFMADKRKQRRLCPTCFAQVTASTPPLRTYIYKPSLKPVPLKREE